MALAKKPAGRHVPVEKRDGVVIRFAGDSGDGMQLAGAQFMNTSAAAGNTVYAIPDFPSEIRAPLGTLAGVSGLQVHFGTHALYTPGDQLDALVAMNPAALQTNVQDVRTGGTLLVNVDAFVEAELQKAGYAGDPLKDGSLERYRVLGVPIDRLNREAIAQLKLSPREVERCKSFFTLGLVFWLFDRPLEPTLQWIQEKFAKNPAVMEANTRTLRAGYHHAEMTDSFAMQTHVAPAQRSKGRYRKVTGNQALVLGLIAATQPAKLSLFFAGTPSTPASDILHQLTELKHHDVCPLQAEDEIAALTMALGASFGGSLGVTATSGPGMSLSADGLGLAVMAELPCVVLNLQRGGPSSGLPTKTEQADLMQALFGRHGECPLPVLAAASAADCFAVAHEAVRLAVRFMTPVVLLSDLSVAQSTELWKVPAPADLPAVQVEHPRAGHEANNGSQPGFLPYARDERLARPWAVPGTPGLEHRVGGLEKEDKTGNVSYDPVNHETMVGIRAAKIANIANDIPVLDVVGPAAGEVPGGWLGRHVRGYSRCGGALARQGSTGRLCPFPLPAPVAQEHPGCPPPL